MNLHRNINLPLSVALHQWDGSGTKYMQFRYN